MKSAPPASAVNHVVLDAALAREEPHRFAALLAQFASGYHEHFSADEAESVEAWAARIAGIAPPQPAMRVAVAVEPVDGGERVIGGAAAEYYRAAGCALVTYLFVRDGGGHRQRGHARTLVTRAVAACAELGPLRAVLAEAEWPDLLPPGQFAPSEVAAARARLGFFARVGTRIVNIDYVQPALGPGQQPVSYLKLLALPMAGGAGGEDGASLRAAVDALLPEFFAALAQQAQGNVDEGVLAGLRRQLARADPLTLPLGAPPPGGPPDPTRGNPARK